MRLDLGEHVVYGGRVAEIVAMERATLGGKEQTFLVLRAGEGVLARIRVPRDQAPTLCRAIIDRARAEQVMATLAQGPSSQGAQRAWREGQRAVEIGDPEGLALVLRRYASIAKERELTGAELAQVVAARMHLTRELAMALGTSEAAVAPRVDALVPKKA